MVRHVGNLVSIRVRFAPSPTGMLHIGGVRTALFNWLFARHYGGTFLLRIEDTDRDRSTPEATTAILDGMRWLGLTWDEPEVYQSHRLERHAAVARQLLTEGKAYRCYATAEELEAMRAQAAAEGRHTVYDRRWRDVAPPVDADTRPYTIRLKAPLTGSVTIHDAVQGDVTVSNENIDDFVLLRSDGTPTYMLSVVVDDHDMSITHVIRGDDHLNNAFRQYHVFQACGWPLPTFAHIPLIHAADGSKLSKRHGAVGVEEYRRQGFLPEAVCNYLLLLGWSHGNQEFFSLTEAISLFDDLGRINRAASRFDRDKFLYINAHHLRALSADTVEQELTAFVGKPPEHPAAFRELLPHFLERSHTLIDLATISSFLFGPVVMSAEAKALLTPEVRERTQKVLAALHDVTPWDAATLQAALKHQATALGVKLPGVLQPLRALLTGTPMGLPVPEVLAALGRNEALRRL
ncbi:MAG: glutamate--tRNA ligase [Holosporales bacterium]|jgi:glutamyl-tRNA synthetase